ncbi:MAG: TRAP transporter substrate-binding protein DctP [Magnetococcales bacterium]|nr:TRAP transporter substrate-binding protein DctP [Magnetococcales bacterium]
MRHPWSALLVSWLLLTTSIPLAHAEPPATPPSAVAEGFIPMRLAAVHKGDVTYVQSLARMIRAIEESTGKQIRPELFANGKKGSEETALQEQLQGNLEGGFYSSLTLARQLPAFRALATPQLFTRPEHLRAFVGSPLDLALREHAKTKKLLVLGYASYGFYGVLNFRPSQPSKDHAPTLTDLTTRVPNDPWMIETHQALGLRPAFPPAADLSEAIASGWIQGVVATPELLNRTAFANTNATAFHHTRHLHGWMILAVNLNWFNGLAPEWQEAITKAAAALPQSVDQALAQEQKILGKWSSENHFTNLTPPAHEVTTQSLKTLAMKNAREMEPLLNLPGAITQMWNQNQLASPQGRREPTVKTPDPGKKPPTRDPAKPRTQP